MDPEAAVYADSDTQRLIDRIERHTRRSRPFFLYGLIAILAGFAILTYRIDVLRREALAEAAHERAEAADLRKKKAALTAKIDAAGALAAKAHATADVPRLLQQIRNVLADASTTTQALGEPLGLAPPIVKASAHRPDGEVDAAATPKAAVAQPPPPAGAAPAEPRPAVIRIFLHIQNKEQFGGAKELQWSLSSASLDGTKIVVPGIETVDKTDDTLRCLKKADCDRVEQVAAIVNAKLRGRILKVKKLDKAYGNAPNVRPGTYEVWLAPGPVYVLVQ
jgi:hypothetical protein